MTSKTSDAPLLDFGAEPTGGPGDVLMLSSNFTLPPLFARGCLLPPVLGEPADHPFFDARQENFVWARRQLPKAWCSEVEQGARNAFPIALRIKWPQGIRELVVAATGRRLPFVLLSDVAALVFRTDQEKKRFVELSFEDFEPAAFGLRIEVDYDVFAGGDAPFVEAIAPQAEDDGGIALGQAALRRADAAAAVVAVLARSAPATWTWMAELSKCLSGEPLGLEFNVETSPLRLCINRPEQWAKSTNVEERLWGAASHAVLSFPLSTGWPASDVLESIYQLAKSDINDGELWRKLDAWRVRSQSVLDASVDVPDLEDKPSANVRRALLLLLLRGDVEGVLATEPGSDAGELRVGPAVHLMALSLAAARTGLRALPCHLKYCEERKHTSAWMNELGSLIVRKIAAFLHADVELPSQSATLVYESFGALDGFWVMKCGRDRVLVRKAYIDPRLQRIAAISRQLGYKMVETANGQLQVAVPHDTGERLVAITLLPTLQSPCDVVRFTCEVALGSGKSGKKRPVRQLSLGKSSLLALLKANAENSMSCRFAIDPITGTVSAIADQQLSTMDEEEFRWHLESVAHASWNGLALLGVQANGSP